MTAPGQPIGAIVARSAVEAQLAAKAVKVEYEEHDPIITIQVRVRMYFLLVGDIVYIFVIRSSRRSIVTYMYVLVCVTGK